MSHTKEPWHVAEGSGTTVIADRVPAIATTIGDECQDNARLVNSANHVLESELEEALESEDKAVRDQANAFLVARAAVAKADASYE